MASRAKVKMRTLGCSLVLSACGLKHYLTTSRPNFISRCQCFFCDSCTYIYLQFWYVTDSCRATPKHHSLTLLDNFKFLFHFLSANHYIFSSNIFITITYSSDKLLIIQGLNRNITMHDLTAKQNEKNFSSKTIENDRVIETWSGKKGTTYSVGYKVQLRLLIS